MDKTLQKILDIELSKGTHQLVCPYCGEVQSATDIDLQMCDDDKTCDRCGESFAYERDKQHLCSLPFRLSLYSQAAF